MHPILINIGPVTIYSYGFFIALAFIVGLLWARHEARTRGLDPRLIADAGFYIILAAIVGSRLLYVLLNPSYFLSNPLEILFFWKGGLVFLGGVILAAVTLLWFFYRQGLSIWPWLDCLAPGIALGQAIGRIGCFLAGCCYGKATSVPWAVTFTNEHSLAPLNVPLHPTQIYHALAGLITFVLLLAFKRVFKGEGQIMGLFLVLYSLFRFNIEFFRGDYRGELGFLSVTQIIAIIVFIMGLCIITKRRA